MDKSEILKFFKNENLPNTYANLCKKFNDFEYLKSPKKEDLLEIVSSNGLKLKYSKSENLLYEETSGKVCDFRFLVSFKDGILSSTYMSLEDNDSDKENLFGYELRHIIEELEPKLMNSLEYPYPLSTSNGDLEEILNFYLNLYKRFKKKFLNQDP